jgi:hypothetical protein
MQREPTAWVYNWATLFLEDINTGIWPSRLGSLRWDSIWVLSDSDHWVITLQTADPSSRQIQDRKFQTNIPTGNNIWSQVTQGCSIPRHTVSRKVTSTSTFFPGSVPGEYDHCSSKNSGPSDGPQDAKHQFIWNWEWFSLTFSSLWTPSP